jgi:hypothetical protein
MLILSVQIIHSPFIANVHTSIHPQLSKLIDRGSGPMSRNPIASYKFKFRLQFTLEINGTSSKLSGDHSRSSYQFLDQNERISIRYQLLRDPRKKSSARDRHLVSEQRGAVVTTLKGPFRGQTK